MSDDPDALKPSIAVVGISAQFPSGRHSTENFDHKSFFDFLLVGGDATERIPRERFNIDGWKGRHIGQISVDHATFLKNINTFDYLEFGISTKDALSMSVSTWKLIEHAFLALLDSGINYRGQNVGSYMSGVPFDILSAADADEYDVHGRFGGGTAPMANKVSYHLDLLGPSLPVDTACSSSLTALHLAVQGIRTGDCDAAVVGGSQINHRFLDWILYSQGEGILAPDGKCKPFDASADGFGRGEAVVVTVIKRLDHAIRDGDHIYATILGTGISSTGGAAPVSAPVAESQVDAMLRAYKGTGRRPSEVDFVELHGTGTVAGDPVETNWVGQHFTSKRNRELLIGSVKANIGHTEITSFLASLSKVCSIFEKGLIPPQINYVDPNPSIHWAEYNLRVPTKVTKLIPSHPSGRSLISICGSGLGGANGHVVIESPPSQISIHDSLTLSPRPVLLVAGGLSPRTATSIASEITTLAAEAADQLPILSNVYGRRARQMTWRTFAVGSPESFIFPAPQFVPRGKLPLIFVFSGQGPQYIEMGRELFETYPPFRESILDMDKIHHELTGISLVRDRGFFGKERPQARMPDIWPVALTVPSLVMIQIALVDLLATFGIRPNVVLGHSGGETAMFYTSNAMSRSLAMEIAVRRSRAMASVDGSGGGMAAISCSAAVAQDIIATVRATSDCSGTLEVACFNGPRAVTISGHLTLLDKAVAEAQSRGLFACRVKTSIPGHSSLLEPCRDAYLHAMDEAFAKYPGSHVSTIPVYSTQTTLKLDSKATAEYMWSNARVPVRFEQTVSALLADIPRAVFLEIGPHPALSTYVSEIGAQEGHVLCPMRRSKEPSAFHEVSSLLQTIGSLSVLGFNEIDFQALNGTQSLALRVALPPYPFTPKTLPTYSEGSQLAVRRQRVRHGPLSYEGIAINSLTHPDLAQHVIMGEPILPATAFLEMLFETGARSIWDIELVSIFPLLAEKLLYPELTLNGSEWQLSSSPRSLTGTTRFSSTRRLHAKGNFSQEMHGIEREPLDLVAIQNRCNFTDLDIYPDIKHFADFGPIFRRIEACYVGPQESLFKIRGDSPELIRDHVYIIHPAVLDSAVHSMLHPMFTGTRDKNVYFLPAKIGQVFLYNKINEGLPEVLYSHVRIQKWTPESLVIDATITDDAGSRICSISNCIIEKHGSVPSPPTRAFSLIHEPFGFPVPAMGPVSVDIDNSIVDDRLPLLVQLRYILEQAVKIGKRVVQILEVGDGHLNLYNFLSDAFKEFSTLMIHYTVNNCTEDLPTSGSTLGMITMNVDISPEDQNVLSSTFDIVIDFHALGLATDLSRALTHLNHILVSGGFLLLHEATYVNGYKAVQEIDSSSDRWYQRWPASLWEEKLLDAQFQILHGDPKTLRCPFLTVLSQKAALSSLTTLSDPADSPVIFTFHLSRILELQNVIERTLKTSQTTIWIEATRDSADGAAATGFTRSLRKELVSLTLNLVLFDSVWDRNDRVSIIINLANIAALESEFIIDQSGSILIPRLVPSPSITSQSIKHDTYWRVDKSNDTVVQPHLPIPGSDQVLIKITLVSSVACQLQTVVGVVHNTTSSRWPYGTRVVAVVEPSFSNFVLTHEGRLCVVPDSCTDTECIRLALPLVVVTLALPMNSMMYPERLKKLQVVVVQDGDIADDICQILRRMSVIVHLISDQLPLSFPSGLPPSSIMICGLPESLIKTINLTSNGNLRVFNWNDSQHGAANVILQNPWLVADVLDIQLPLHWSLGQENQNHSYRKPEDQISANVSISPSIALRHDKFYLIIGGLGSLGIRTAIWMHSKGARRIVLTSRTGRTRYGPSIRALEYLRGLPGIELRIVACDATSIEGLKSLIQTLEVPLAGCILSTIVQHNDLFLKQTESTFPIPFTAKSCAFEAITAAIPINDLDFLVTISSIGIFGRVGASNYSSANTLLDSLVAPYSNAFSLVAPLIIDSEVAIVNMDLVTNEVIRMTSFEICQCIEDGLIRLQSSQRLPLYIPNFDWDLLREWWPCPLYNHLIQTRVVKKESTNVDNIAPQLQEIVLKFIDVSPEEFSHQIPLTSYGLDSLAAAMLSSALRPYIFVSQIQLLSDLSLADIIAKRGAVDQTVHNKTALNPSDVNSSDAQNETILYLLKGHGTPLIIIHGGAGNVTSFEGLIEYFKTPLWAIRHTADAPVDSLNSLAQFYFDKIKEARPLGPYRLAGFSASSLITLNVARLFEAHGDELVQLTFIDHFPLFFTCPVSTPAYDALTLETIAQAEITGAVDTIQDVCSRESSPVFRLYGENLVVTSKGRYTSPSVQRAYNTIQTLATLNSAYWVELIGGISQWEVLTTEERMARVQEAIKKYLSKIHSPITVYVATRGLSFSLPSDWKTLGATFSDQVAIITIDSAHFDIFQQEGFAQSLERDWLQMLWKNHKLQAKIHNPLKDDLLKMLSVLDSMSLEVMTKTIQLNPTVGSEISRQRYDAFTRNNVQLDRHSPYTEDDIQYLGPRMVPWFEILKRIGNVHPSIFQSQAGAVAALYSDDLMDRFYQNNLVNEAVCQELARVFKSMISSASSRPFRVLEVGAGVGGLTTLLVDVLGDMFDIEVEYTVSDISPFIIRRLVDNLGVSSLQSKVLDISKPPDEQGLSLKHYDLIVGYHVVHTAPDLQESLMHLNALLRPGGHLLVIEPNGSIFNDSDPGPGMLWFNLVFGAFQGWFGYADDRAHCTLGAEKWKEVLEKTGFSDFQSGIDDVGVNLLLYAAKSEMNV